MDDHHRVLSKAHPVDHFAVVRQVADRARDHLRPQAPELRELAGVREPVAVLLRERVGGSELGGKVLERVAVLGVRREGKHLGGHAREADVLNSTARQAKTAWAVRMTGHTLAAFHSMSFMRSLMFCLSSSLTKSQPCFLIATKASQLR